MSTSIPTIPEDFVLDVHDLAAIILDTHASTETLLPRAQLVEINRGITSLESLPAHVLTPTWQAARATGRKRIAYILKTDSAAAERVTIDTFPHPGGVKTTGGDELTRRDVENVFWRCKTCNNGYLLAYVAQRVFDSLPPTTKLRARTSARHEVVCKPSDVSVGEICIVPKEACFIVDHEPRPDLGPYKVELSHQCLLGFDGPMHWVFLLVGKPMSADMEIVLDLSMSQIGGRGGGGEVFSLERAFDYHDKVLPKVADQLDGYKLSKKLRIPEDDIRARGDALVDAVMDRVRKIARGQDEFCRYCGKDGVSTRCSKCKKAYFCSSCHTPGWKYHKVWCN